MQNIIIGRYDADPEAQGVIKPEDGSWQLVLDKEGIPHLYVRCHLDETELEPGEAKDGLLCIEDVLPPDITIRDLMKSKFGGKLSPDEEKEAVAEWSARKEANGIPCPR
jgi:hypothetical protein